MNNGGAFFKRRENDEFSDLRGDYVMLRLQIIPLNIKFVKYVLLETS